MFLILFALSKTHRNRRFGIFLSYDRLIGLGNGSEQQRLCGSLLGRLQRLQRPRRDNDFTRNFRLFPVVFLLGLAFGFPFLRVVLLHRRRTIDGDYSRLDGSLGLLVLFLVRWILFLRLWVKTLYHRVNFGRTGTFYRAQSALDVPAETRWFWHSWCFLDCVAFRRFRHSNTPEAFLDAQRACGTVLLLVALLPRRVLVTAGRVLLEISSTLKCIISSVVGSSVVGVSQRRNSRVKRSRARWESIGVVARSKVRPLASRREVWLFAARRFRSSTSITFAIIIKAPAWRRHAQAIFYWHYWRDAWLVHAGFKPSRLGGLLRRSPLLLGFWLVRLVVLLRLVVRLSRVTLLAACLLRSLKSEIKCTFQITIFNVLCELIKFTFK